MLSSTHSLSECPQWLRLDCSQSQNLGRECNLGLSMSDKNPVISAVSTARVGSKSWESSPWHASLRHGLSKHWARCLAPCTLFKVSVYLGIYSLSCQLCRNTRVDTIRIVNVTLNCRVWRLEESLVHFRSCVSWLDWSGFDLAVGSL